MSTLKIRLGRVKGSIWYTGTADSNTAIATALTSAGYTPIKLDMYLNTSNGNVYQYLPLDDGLQWVLQGNLRGTIGPEGLQGRGYYRANIAIDVASTTVARLNINPLNCKLLTSDTIVDSIGNCFAVTKNCDIGAETVYIAHRGYLGGANGKDGKDGLGVPAGGTTGQVLTKLSDADNDTAWKDPSGGGNTASEVLSVRTQLKTLPTTWEAKTWNGLTEFYGSLVWTDGENIYYSYLTEQYVLNRATSTWEPKTWNGLDNFEGQFVWTDGENIYYSKDTSNQYVLNRATSTWEPKTWNGNTPKGSFVWTDGENIYHNQYVLNKSTSTWEAKTWNGLQRPEGIYVWTDGENIYYSKDNSNQYVLDKATDTWQSKAWKTLDGSEIFSIFPKANKIWSDGENVYHSYSHVLNKETGNWEYKSWSLSSFDSAQIWTDGKNTYYNNSGSNQSYVLLPAIKGTSPSYKLKIREGYYSKPESGIPESDLNADVQAKLNSGGTGNLLKGEITLTAEAGTYTTIAYTDYPLNLVAGRKYKLEIVYNGVNLSQEAIAQPMGVEELGINSVGLDYEFFSGTTIRPSIFDKVHYSESGIVSNENLATILLTIPSALANTTVFKSITEYTEVVADKVKNPLKITVNGEEKTYDGSEAVEVDINTSGGAENLLKGDVTVTVADGVLNVLNELGYPLGISADRSYKVTVNYDGENKDIIIKSSDWNKNGTAVGAIAAINNDVRIMVFDGMSADRSINPNTSCLGIDRGGSSGSLSVVFKSITEIEETPASYKLKQVSVSSGETMSSVVTKITDAVTSELTAQGKTSAIVAVVFNRLMIADAVSGGSSNNRAFVEIFNQTCARRVTADAMDWATPLVRAVGDSTSSVWGSGIWAVSVQFGKVNSNIVISTGGGGIGGSGASFKDLSNFVADGDATIDLIFY